MDLSDVVLNQEAFPFTVLRSVGAFAPGGWQETRTVIKLFGRVNAATDKDISMVPEGDRVGQLMTFHAAEPLYVTHLSMSAQQQPGTSDIVEWHGAQYRLLHVLDYGAVAGFWKGIGARLLGA